MTSKQEMTDQFATKACLLYVVEVCHKRLQLATDVCLFIVLKLREQTLEVRGNFLASTQFYKHS
jgi:hypothetical protein